METWQEFEKWLNCRNMFHMQLGLERMNKAMELLKLHNLPFHSVQILGTNGKGSICAILDAISREHGIKTGLYTSPHLVSVKERILVNGCHVQDGIWLKAAREIFSVYKNEPDLTYFEFLTILSLLVFKYSEVKIAVFEAGLGGKNDATSAINASAQGYGIIGLDHENLIGPSLWDIAKDKSAAIRASHVVMLQQKPEMLHFFEMACKKRSAGFITANADCNYYNCGLSGSFQNANAALASELWKILAKKHGLTYNEKAVEKGIANAFLPGRLQIVSACPQHAELILDGGHNPPAIQNLVRELENYKKPSAIIYSCLKDKNWKKCLEILKDKFYGLPFFIPELNNSRAENVENVAEFVKNNSIAIKGANSFLKAFNLALNNAGCKRGQGPILITGSFYLLAEFFALFPQYLQKN